MGNIGVNAVRSLVAPDDMPPPGTKLYAHAAALVAQEPVAYLHTVTQNGADTDQALSFTPDAFPLQGVGGFRSIGIIPLYATPVAAQAHPVVKKSLITGLAQDREDAIPERDAVDLAREGMELHKPGQPEYIVCAELVRIAEGGR